MIEFERLLLRELLREYQDINYCHFRDALRVPQLALAEGTSFLGRWLVETRTLELSRNFVTQTPWGSIVEVLKHEMAHQYVAEVLRVEEPSHGPMFRATCQRLGIDHGASGLPRTGNPAETHPLLDRVQKLLALAQSDNRHEAEAAAAAAQKLILKHNLRPDARAARGDYSFAHLGRPTGRVAEWQRHVGGILSSHFCVAVVWVSVYRPQEQKRGTVLEAIGTLDNLALAAYVHDFLASSAEHAWAQHRRAHNLGNRERLTFLAGVMSGFSAKLAEQARLHSREGLVWVPHADLTLYKQLRYPRLHSIKRVGHVRSGTFAAGQKAGRDVVLHRGLTGSGGGETRLLGDGD